MEHPFQASDIAGEDESPAVLLPSIDRGELVAIAAGGAVGALARVGLTQIFPTAAGSWPWATFAVNIAGAFLLGCLLAAVARREPSSIPIYRLLGTGFCSTATTFATVQVELLRMIDRDRYALAAAYIAASVAGGYIAVSAGRRLVGRKGQPHASDSVRRSHAARPDTEGAQG